MIIPIPDSLGHPPPDSTPLLEKWSDEARAGALAARRAGRKYQSKQSKRVERERGQKPFANRGETEQLAAHARGGEQARRGAIQATGAQAKAHFGKAQQQEQMRRSAIRKREEDAKKAAGAGKTDDGSPKRQGESTNDKGERVIKYSDGSTVTVGKDGSATRKKADGTEVKGKYKDPEPREKEPEGFKGETQADRDRATKKAETDAKRVERETATSARKADSEKKKADREAETARKKKASVRSARNANVRRQHTIGAARRTAARYEATYERRR